MNRCRDAATGNNNTWTIQHGTLGHLVGCLGHLVGYMGHLVGCLGHLVGCLGHLVGYLGHLVGYLVWYQYITSTCTVPGMAH
jgi:hypothetical protein